MNLQPRTTIERNLETFRTKYSSIRVTVYDDMLVYKVGKGCAKRAATDANELIEKLEIDLVAIPSAYGDSFFVQSNCND